LYGNEAYTGYGGNLDAAALYGAGGYGEPLLLNRQNCFLVQG
jgi:hypothetical protein